MPSPLYSSTVGSFASSYTDPFAFSTLATFPSPSLTIPSFPLTSVTVPSLLVPSSVISPMGTAFGYPSSLATIPSSLSPASWISPWPSAFPTDVVLGASTVDPIPTLLPERSVDETSDEPKAEAETEPAPPKQPVKISYFDAKGRAFFPMLVAEYGDIPYEWNKIAMEDWPALKPQTIFGQLPMMEHGDIVITQSNAIAAYLGRLAGLSGNEDADYAISQMLVAQYEDMFSTFAKNYYSSNKEEDTDAYLANKLPQDLANLEKLVSGGFTNERTIGELAIFAFLNIMLDMKPDCLEAFPALNAFYQHLADHPKISAFLAERAGTQWFKKTW